MSPVYCFEKLYEAIYRPETEHPQFALGKHGYIDRLLKTIERFKNRLHLEGRDDEYQSVIDKFKEFEKYFHEYLNTNIKKRDTYKLRDDVYKQIRKWNNGIFVLPSEIQTTL